jgi:ureidoglycolate lyase
MKPLKVEALTAEAFREFGDLISTAGRASHAINQGNTKRYAELALVDANAEDGEAAVHIYRSKALELPLVIREMEKHPLSSQAFMPLHDYPFLVIVAPAGERVESDAVRAFITDGKQGINLRRGTWHHYQVSLSQASLSQSSLGQESKSQEFDYLVIDRVGPGKNLEEQPLSPSLVIEKIPVQ